MKITSDKESTKIVKKFLTKIGSLTFHDNWNGFGDVTIRIVSVGETDKYNWNESKYSRVLNIEVTARKEGFTFSENKIPHVYSWGSTRMAFFKRRKSHTEYNFNKMISQTNIPLFFKMASIPGPRYNNNEYMGNVTFKYID
jgi:hypothetical protein